LGAGYLALAALLYGWSRSITPEDRAWDDVAFLAVFLVGWLVPAIATVGRLWRAGTPSSRVVRARMRLLAVSMLSLSVAIVLVVVAPPGRVGPSVAANAVALLSALLAMAGFAPPLPLRLWWRRQGAQYFQRMQEQLIAAVTPQECAEAVAPTLANHVGAGVAILTPDGGLLASAGLSAEDVAGLAAGGDASPAWKGETQEFNTRHARLLVRLTPYSPLFGDTERELAGAYAWQLQLALERSEYAAKHLAARREIERAKRELETMLLGLSHDLRSPAVAVSGYAELLGAAESDAERAHLLEGLRASSDYLGGLVDSLLELARLGQVPEAVEAVDLGQLAHGVRDRLVVAAPQASIEIAGELPTVHVEPVRAEQVLDNLLGNAVKHAGRTDVRVVLSGRPLGDGWELEVRDDGRGIPADDRERVFDLFQRGGNATAPGTGIGLGMVRRIIEQWGGSIRLAEAGQGARFVVSLPHRVLQPGSARGSVSPPVSHG
jgi:signal transduction histidine kinase